MGTALQTMQKLMQDAQATGNHEKFQAVFDRLADMAEMQKQLGSKDEEVFTTAQAREMFHGKGYKTDSIFGGEFSQEVADEMLAKSLEASQFKVLKNKTNHGDAKADDREGSTEDARE